MSRIYRSIILLNRTMSKLNRLFRKNITIRDNLLVSIRNLRLRRNQGISSKVRKLISWLIFSRRIILRIKKNRIITMLLLLLKRRKKVQGDHIFNKLTIIQLSKLFNLNLSLPSIPMTFSSNWAKVSPSLLTIWT